MSHLNSYLSKSEVSTLANLISSAALLFEEIMDSTNPKDVEYCKKINSTILTLMPNHIPTLFYFARTQPSELIKYEKIILAYQETPNEEHAHMVSKAYTVLAQEIFNQNIVETTILPGTITDDNYHLKTEQLVRQALDLDEDNEEALTILLKLYKYKLVMPNPEDFTGENIPSSLPLQLLDISQQIFALNPDNVSALVSIADTLIEEEEVTLSGDVTKFLSTQKTRGEKAAILYKYSLALMQEDFPELQNTLVGLAKLVLFDVTEVSDENFISLKNLDLTMGETSKYQKIKKLCLAAISLQAIKFFDFF